MERSLSREYLKLLIAVQEEPFGTLQDLADRAEISKPTAIKRLKDLKGQGAFEKQYFRVKPLLDYRSLGLEAVDVLAETKGIDDVLELEIIAKKHPYTVYRSRCYGFTNGLLMQFRPPVGTRKMMEELFKRLKDRGTVSKFSFLATGAYSVYTSMRLDEWNSDKMIWDFSWKDWFEREIRSKSRSNKEGKPGSALEWVTKQDLYIIQEMMRGSRRMNTEIIESLKEKGISFTPQTFSRHYNMIRENCISGYRVTFDPDAFDILSNILMVGKADQVVLNDLRARIDDNPIPFESTFRVKGNQLFWFIRLHPRNVATLLNELYSRLDSMGISFLDYNHSYLYDIWPEAFDDDNRQWKRTQEFMLDNVLA